MNGVASDARPGGDVMIPNVVFARTPPGDKCPGSLGETH
jgi:hypothetical protein